MCEATVIVAMLVMADIALHLWQLWPESGPDDIDVSNPVGFREYDPEEHWDEPDPEEVP